MRVRKLKGELVSETNFTRAGEAIPGFSPTTIDKQRTDPEFVKINKIGGTKNI